MITQSLKFFKWCGFKWIDPKEFDMNKYTSNSSKGWAVEINVVAFFAIVFFENIYLIEKPIL